MYLPSSTWIKSGYFHLFKFKFYKKKHLFNFNESFDLKQIIIKYIVHIHKLLLLFINNNIKTNIKMYINFIKLNNCNVYLIVHF